MPANTTYTWEKYDWLNPFTNKAVAAYPPIAAGPALPNNTAGGTYALSGTLQVTGTVNATTLSVSGATSVASLAVSGNVGFFGTAITTKKTVTGAKGSNAALGSLLTALAAYGLITDSSSA